MNISIRGQPMHNRPSNSQLIYIILLLKDLMDENRELKEKIDGINQGLEGIRDDLSGKSIHDNSSP